MSDLTLEAAQTIVSAALKHGRGANMKPLGVVVLDARGALKAYAAEDKSSLKRFEIGLRGFAPRIERLRREVPARYELYIRTLGIYVRDARSKALEPMFGNAVRPDEP